MNMNTLFSHRQGAFREASAADVLRCAEAVLRERLHVGLPILNSPQLVNDYLRMHLGQCDYEVFGLLHLNAQRRLIHIEDLFRGTTDQASVWPREVARSIVSRNTACVICYHNHPSGVAEPSDSDRRMTTQLAKVLLMLDVRLLDHLIVGDTVYSFAHHGLV